jgi:quercetin dioxygenase-like cupin family protein
MAHAGQELHGPGGFRLLLVKTAAETDGELLEMEANYAGTGAMPPEHLHPSQAERFEVLEGEAKTIIGGTERRYEAGETFEVPAGVPHQMGSDVPTRMRWEVRPALRMAEFFEALYGAMNAGEGERVPAILEEFSAEIRLTAARPVD